MSDKLLLKLDGITIFILLVETLGIVHGVTCGDPVNIEYGVGIAYGVSTYLLGDFRAIVEGDDQVDIVMLYASEAAIVLIVVVKSPFVIRDSGSAGGDCQEKEGQYPTFVHCIIFDYYLIIITEI